VTDANGADEPDLDVDDDDEYDEDDGWGTTGLRDRLLGGPPLWLALVAAVLVGLGLLNGVAAWKLYGDFECSSDFGNESCPTERWSQLQAFLSSAAIYVLAATAALIGHALVVERYSARQPRT
jgi:hypothetical protein